MAQQETDNGNTDSSLIIQITYGILTYKKETDLPKRVEHQHSKTVNLIKQKLQKKVISYGILTW